MSISQLGKLVALDQTVSDLMQRPPRNMTKEAIGIYSPPGLDEEEEEEEKRKQSPLWSMVGAGGLGVGLGGLGMLGMAHGMGSDKKWSDAVSGMHNMRDARPHNIPKDVTMLQHYANQMTPASSLSVFGKPVHDLVPLSRFQPWFTGKEPLAPTQDPAVAKAQDRMPSMQADPPWELLDGRQPEALLGTNYAGNAILPNAKPGTTHGPDSVSSHLRAGRFSNALAQRLERPGTGGTGEAVATFLREGIGQPSATITNSAQYRAAAAHYEAFSKGPVPGYDHMLRGYEGGYPIQDERLLHTRPKLFEGGGGGQPGELPGEATGQTEVVPMTHGEYFGPLFTQFIKRKSGEMTDPTNQFLLPHEFNQDMMPREEQAELLKEWTRSLNPAQRAELERNESPAESPLGNENYRPIVENFNDLRNTLKKYALPTAAAGIGIYALYKIVNLIRDRMAEDEEEEEEKNKGRVRQPQLKAADWTETPWYQKLRDPDTYGLKAGDESGAGGWWYPQMMLPALAALGGVGGAVTGASANALRGEDVGRGAITGGLTGLGSGLGLGVGVEGAQRLNSPHWTGAEKSYAEDDILTAILGTGGAAGAGLGGTAGYQIAQWLQGKKNDEEEEKAADDKKKSFKDSLKDVGNRIEPPGKAKKAPPIGGVVPWWQQKAPAGPPVPLPGWLGLGARNRIGVGPMRPEGVPDHFYRDSTAPDGGVWGDPSGPRSDGTPFPSWMKRIVSPRA